MASPNRVFEVRDVEYTIKVDENGWITVTMQHAVFSGEVVSTDHMGHALTMIGRLHKPGEIPEITER